MMKLRPARVLLIGICVSAVVVVGYSVLTTRPWRSAESVKALIAKETPPCSSIEQVERFIQEQGWGMFLDFQGNTSTRRDERAAGVLGFRILGAKLPPHGFPFRIHTEAYWGFDVHGNLVDVNVRSWSEVM
jgi:hypothetical protein